MNAVTVHKVRSLRAYLVAFKEFTTPSFNVDMPIRGGVHASGSRFTRLANWLMPDVLLVLDRNESNPVFIMVMESGEILDATISGVDSWLEAHSQEIVKQDTSAALQVLWKSASRLPNRADISASHKALNILKKVFES